MNKKRMKKFPAALEINNEKAYESEVW